MSQILTTIYQEKIATTAQELRLSQKNTTHSTYGFNSSLFESLTNGPKSSDRLDCKSVPI
jgi:hypothetical protein